MYKSLPLALILGLAASPALADRPPADALPLSEIVQMIEAERDVAYFEEVEWDDDGHWEIEYIEPNGRKIEIEVDPRTGRVRN
jgi:uncharacterized membrane protein YkoI